MAVFTGSVSVSTKGKTDIIDITDRVHKQINASGIKNGTTTIFCPGSTGGLTTIEYEPGLVKDIKEIYEKFLPYKDDYHHHRTWGCDNGSSHVRAAMMGPSLAVPFVDGKMTLGTWQQIIFIDFDTRGRSRELVVQIVGD